MRTRLQLGKRAFAVAGPSSPDIRMTLEQWTKCLHLWAGSRPTCSRFPTFTNSNNWHLRLEHIL